MGYWQVPLSARRQDMPPGQVVEVSPRTAQKFSQSGFPFSETCSDAIDLPPENSVNGQAITDKQGKPLNPRLPTISIRYDHPHGTRKQHWKVSAVEESVGVGAHFEATHSGAIRVRGLSKGSPADLSGLFSIGDELIEARRVRCALPPGPTGPLQCARSHPSPAVG